jgi:hypothetical protein
MAALAIVAGAPIVLFPDEDRFETAPPPAAGSSEVTQVTAPSPGGDESAGPAGPPDSEGSAPAVGPPVASGAAPAIASGSPTDGEPLLPRRPARQEPSDPGDEEPPASEDGKDKQKKHKDKSKNGNAYGHDKSHGKGKAKGHDKWHGSSEAKEKKSKPAPVAFAPPPRGKKQGHVHHSGTGKHAGRGHRPHTRPRR